MLDFARTFPPEAPAVYDCYIIHFFIDIYSFIIFSVPHKSVMYYRLRSEFVKKFDIPLSSDSYSAFGKDEADVHDKEVKKVRVIYYQKCNSRVCNHKI